MKLEDYVYRTIGERMTLEEYLNTLTPEQREQREGGLRRAEEIEAEVAKLDLPPRKHVEEVNKRLRAELPEEAQQWIEDFDAEVIRQIDARDNKAEQLKEEYAKRQEVLKMWRDAGEAPNVGLFFELYATEAPIYSFFTSTGILIPRPARNTLLKFQTTGYYPFMLSSLEKLRKFAFLTAIGKKYEDGKISKKLLKILKIIPEFPEITIKGDSFLNADSWEYVTTAAANKEIDLSSYSDIEQKKIRVAPFCFLGYYGSLDNILQFVDVQKNILLGQITAVIAAAFDSQYNPLKESDLREFIELLTTRELADYTPEDATKLAAYPPAYFNVARKKLYDLRPYAAELEELFQIPDFSFIGELTGLLIKLIEERRERQKIEMNAGDEELLTLFPDVYYYPPETAKDFRNLPISKPEKLLIRSYANARINGGSMELTDRNNNVLQRLQFTDLNGKVSEEVIRPFDVSIMNCIGSLQQKYASRAAFTDIEIAKEFNSTLDKKGNIKPDSKIVKEVRESMRRLSSTFGSIDITQQIEEEQKRRKPDLNRIERLKRGTDVFCLSQRLVNISKTAFHALRNDTDTLLYFIDGSPLFYLHAAITHQIAQVPFSQINSKKNLTTEIRLLREQTRIALETAISMKKNHAGGNVIKFNPIIDATFRTSADSPEDPTRVEATELVKAIPERKRYRLQEQIRQYLDELIQHKFIAGYKVLKKRMPGARRQIDYGFEFTLPEDPQKKTRK